MLRSVIFAVLCVGFAATVSVAQAGQTFDWEAFRRANLERQSRPAGEPQSQRIFPQDTDGCNGVYEEPHVVEFDPKVAVWSVVVKSNECRLYLVYAPGWAKVYRIGVARDNQFSWREVTKVGDLQEHPTWHPPKEMIAREAARRHYLPEVVYPGPNNPLGERAIYLHHLSGGDTQYRIHGTIEPHTIGSRVSSGCIRMRNKDVVELYKYMRVGDTVLVQ